MEVQNQGAGFRTADLRRGGAAETVSSGGEVAVSTRARGGRGIARHWKWMGALLLMALLLSSPQAATRGAAEAMAHWYTSVAPALLPFLALMPLLTCPEASWAYERLLGRAMGTLFNLPGAAAPAMLVGLVAGAPAGAVAARRIAAREGMNRGQLFRMAAAFTGFSPAFLVAGVGAGMLGEVTLGWKLLVAQTLTQLTLALILRRAWADRTLPVTAASPREEEQPLRAAAMALLAICGAMGLFGSLTAVAGEYLGRGPAEALLCLLDVPSGARVVAEGHRVILLAAMCGFGGLCVAVQSLGALRGCGIVAAEYIGVRLLAGSICGGYMALLTRVGPGAGTGITGLAGINPLPLAGLAASSLSIPVLLKLRKSVS